MSNCVFVTGGAGYIGSHACKALALAGYTPVTIDNLIHGHRSAVKWGPLEEGDVCHSAFLLSLFKKYQPVGVLHFAAYSNVGESVQDPLKYYSNNVGGMLSLLKAIKSYLSTPLIFSSTCAVYGIPQRLPLNENHSHHPINPYGVSKSISERFLSDSGIPYMGLRYFNASGADPEGEIGEDHTPETHLIPLALQTILGKRPHLELFGTNYETPDGTAIRDYIHVSDLADAHVKALNLILSGHKSCTINLGTGQGYSVREIINMVEKVTEKKLSIKETSRREGDPPILVSDTTLSKNLLNWSPKHSQLENLIQTAWQWLKK